MKKWNFLIFIYIKNYNAPQKFLFGDIRCNHNFLRKAMYKCLTSQLFGQVWTATKFLKSSYNFFDDDRLNCMGFRYPWHLKCWNWSPFWHCWITKKSLSMLLL